MFKKITIDGTSLTDWNAFHEVFEKALNFPAYYGKNMDAWIECMTEIKESLLISITDSEAFKESSEEIYFTVLECTALVNSIKLDEGYDTVIAVSLD
jgi:RNAse (barnase) inhibitor barstar